MAEEGITVQGIADVVKALQVYDVEAAAGLKKELKDAGGKVRDEAQDRFEGYSPTSALGYRVYLRGGGSRVDVEQSIGRTTGLRPDFGTLQMRKALLPSLADKQDEIYADVEAMLTELSHKTF